MKILGYKRENGRYGIRNHLLVIPTSVCASETACKIAALVPGSIAIPHQHGCCQIGEDFKMTVRTLIGFGVNPNVAAVLVVGLGCEGIQAEDVAAEIAKSGKRVECLTIQGCKGTVNCTAKGAELLSRMAREVSGQKREYFDISELIVGMECGGSDPTSGIASNPTIGNASDRVIEDGGSTILSETTECIGAEHLIAARFIEEKDKELFLDFVKQTEARAALMGHDFREGQPTPGNIAGGITTIEEKSLGCMYKAGTKPFVGCLAYAQKVDPDKKGLYFMDTPGEDIDSITGMIAGGAQIIIFSTGRGTPTGSPIAPVIKITGNDDTYQMMEDNIDMNAGVIITEGVTIQDMGKKLYDEIIDVCNGKLTKGESLGHREFGVFRVGFTF